MATNVNSPAAEFHAMLQRDDREPPNQVCYAVGPDISELYFSTPHAEWWKFDGWGWKCTNMGLYMYDKEKYVEWEGPCGSLWILKEEEEAAKRCIAGIAISLQICMGDPAHPMFFDYDNRSPVWYHWYKDGHCFKLTKYGQEALKAEYVGSCVDDPFKDDPYGFCKGTCFTDHKGNKFYDLSSKPTPAGSYADVWSSGLQDEGEERYAGSKPAVRYPCTREEDMAARTFFNSFKSNPGEAPTPRPIEGLVVISPDGDASYWLDDYGNWHRHDKPAKGPVDGQSNFWAATPDCTIMLTGDQATGLSELARNGAAAAASLYATLMGGDIRYTDQNAPTTVYEELMAPIPAGGKCKFLVWYGNDCLYYNGDKLSYVGSWGRGMDAERLKIQRDFKEHGDFEFGTEEAAAMFDSSYREYIKICEEGKDDILNNLDVHFRRYLLGDYSFAYQDFRAGYNGLGEYTKPECRLDLRIQPGSRSVYHRYRPDGWESSEYLPDDMLWFKFDGLTVYIDKDDLQTFQENARNLGHSYRIATKGEDDSKPAPTPTPKATKLPECILVKMMQWAQKGFPSFVVWFGDDCFFYSLDGLSYAGSKLPDQDRPRLRYDAVYNDGYYLMEDDRCLKEFKGYATALEQGYKEVLRKYDYRFSADYRRLFDKAAEAFYKGINGVGRDGPIPFQGVFFTDDLYDTFWSYRGGQWVRIASPSLPDHWVQFGTTVCFVPPDCVDKFLDYADIVGKSIYEFQKVNVKKTDLEIVDSLFKDAQAKQADAKGVALAYLKYADGRVMVYSDLRWESRNSVPAGEFTTVMGDGFTLGFKDGVNLTVARATLKIQ